jgi:hypothetical protein
MMGLGVVLVNASRMFGLRILTSFLNEAEAFNFWFAWLFVRMK